MQAQHRVTAQQIVLSDVKITARCPVSAYLLIGSIRGPERRCDSLPVGDTHTQSPRCWAVTGHRGSAHRVLILCHRGSGPGRGWVEGPLSSGPAHSPSDTVENRRGLERKCHPGWLLRLLS